MTSYQNVLQFDLTQLTAIHIIKDDTEALVVAHALAEQFKVNAIQRDAQRILPFQEVAAFSQSGLWAITVPKEYGGAEVSTLTVAKIIALMSGIDGSLGQIPQNHFYALEVLRNTATAAQKKRLYAEILKGARLGNALAEFKTRSAGIRQTSIQAKAHGFSVNGEKFYCTGSLFAHRIPTLVKDQNEREFLAFIPRQSTGLSIQNDWSGFGQRTTGSGTVKFNHVHVDAEDVIPFSEAFERPTIVGPFAQIMHAAIETGIARAAFEESLVRIRQARPWIDAGVTSATQDPLTLYQLGRMIADVRATEVLLKQAARSIDIAKVAPTAENVAQASIDVAKVRALSTEIALQNSSKLIELAGSRACQHQDGLDRFWRNARTHTLHDASRWKYYFIGQYVLNDILPPRRGTL